MLPVDIRVSFSNGSSRDERWDGVDRWRVMTFPGDATITSVEVDPNAVLLLDVNRTNNSWAAQPETDLAVKRWTLRWITWAEELLLTYGFFS